MKISIRAEGGAGDVILATRFVPAIRDKFQSADINIFIDSSGNAFQKEFLETFYPSFYDNIFVIPNKKYSSCVIDSQFGEEVNAGVWQNVPDEYKRRMKEDYDLCVDMHIDSMDWIKYPFNFFKYFYQFPTPKIEPNNIELPEKFAFIHLAANIYRGPNMNDPWYNKKLLEKLSKEIHCIVTVTDTTYPILKEFEGMPNVTLINTDLKTVGYMISRASLFLGIDSGLKYLAYGLGIPCILFAQFSPEPHKVRASHKLRWLIHPEYFIPVNYNFQYVVEWAKRIIENPFYAIVPEVKEFDSECIVRHYQVNEAKSILA